MSTRSGPERTRYDVAMNDPPPFSVARLAERWDCSEGLVRKLIETKELSAFRVGTLIRIRAPEVERYERETAATIEQTSPTDGALEPPRPVIGRAKRKRAPLLGG